MMYIFQVFGIMNYGGAETFLMNVYRKTDRRKFQFGFIVHSHDKGKYDDEIKSLGGELFYVPKFNGKNLIEYIKSFERIFRNNPQYKIIHGHMYTTAGIYLYAAKKNGLLTIAHSHSTSNGFGLEKMVRAILRFPIRYIADKRLACSNAAGRWLYGNKKCEVVPNAVNIEQFKFSEENRTKLRKKYSLENTNVVIHVGRFYEVKNHKRIIKIFEAYKKKDMTSKLVLVGTGELIDDIKECVIHLGLEKDVLFVGAVSNVEEWLSAGDIFLFPSLYEGLPLSLVEAEISGLKCVISSHISNEACVVNVKKTELTDSNELWADNMQQQISDHNDRKNCYKNFVNSDFDVEKVVKKLEKIYGDWRNEE